MGGSPLKRTSWAWKRPEAEHWREARAWEPDMSLPAPSVDVPRNVRWLLQALLPHLLMVRMVRMATREVPIPGPGTLAFLLGVPLFLQGLGQTSGRGSDGLLGL